MLGQYYLARHPEEVDRLVLSSTGPADYRLPWLPVACLISTLLRVLPERRVKALLATRLGTALGTAGQDQGWLAALSDTLDHDLTRADVISHFAVTADVIKSRAVRPGAFQAWGGQAVVLSAENDPTQSDKDRARYEKVLGRPVEVIGMGQAGHIACLLAPHQYVTWLEQALAAAYQGSADDRAEAERPRLR